MILFDVFVQLRHALTLINCSGWWAYCMDDLYKHNTSIYTIYRNTHELMSMYSAQFTLIICMSNELYIHISYSIKLLVCYMYIDEVRYVLIIVLLLLFQIGHISCNSSLLWSFACDLTLITLYIHTIVKCTWNRRRR